MRRHKTVRFEQFAEQVEFDVQSDGGASDTSSVISFTEDQLLEAQGECDFTTYSVPAAEEGDGAAAPGSYQQLLGCHGAVGGGGALGGGSSGREADGWQRPRGGASGDCSRDVFCKADSSGEASGRHAAGAAAASCGDALADTATLLPSGSAGFERVALSEAAAGLQPATAPSEYRLRFFTGDRLSGGLASGQHVCVEIFGAGLDGATPTCASHALPRARGAFGRGAVDVFTLTGAPRLGRVEALAVWHEPGGAALGGGWSCEVVELEDRHRGESS
jgi:hypothetical protein